MRLKAGCELTMTATSTTPFVAQLRPQSGDAQTLEQETFTITPPAQFREYLDCFGNLCQRFSAPAETFTIRSDVIANVADTILVDRSAAPMLAEAIPDSAMQYLLPSRYCPSDKLIDKAQEIVGQELVGYPQVEAIVRFIRENIQYRYGVSNASTSALDTLSQGAGVCRDFAHVGISLCRALQIPARMVTGYLYGLEPMDQHAWFEAFLGGCWYTFDATQDRPKGGRITIAYGRDAADVALLSDFGDAQTRDMKVWVELA